MAEPGLAAAAPGRVCSMTAPDRTTTTLLLVRHGQSLWNAEGRWQGQADPALSALGQEQANVAASRIGAVDAIASSPQQRALQTALAISEATGVGPVVVVDDLKERSAGPWSGLTRPEIEAAYPNFLRDDKRPEGYESDESLLARTLPALEQLAIEYAGSTLLVATHGGVIHNLEEHFDLEIGRVPNLSGRVLFHEDGWRAGDQITLLDEDLLTGGDPQRV